VSQAKTTRKSSGGKGFSIVQRKAGGSKVKKVTIKRGLWVGRKKRTMLKKERKGRPSWSQIREGMKLPTGKGEPAQVR